MSKFDNYPIQRLFLEAEEPASVKRQHTLKIDAGSSMSEVFVIDDEFNMVARGIGSLTAKLPSGDYLVKYRTGENIKEDWIRLRKNTQIQGSQVPLPPTTAPISERAGWPTAESDLAERLRTRFPISVVVRDPSGPPPFDDVRILDRDGILVAGMRDAQLPPSDWARDAAGSVVGFGGKVAPGGYIVLILTPGLRPYGMPVWVAPNCSTQVFLERKQLGMKGSRRIGPQLASASVFITANLAPWDAIKELLLLSDTAKSVLSHDRPLVPSPQELDWALGEKYLCPSLGLLAAHLLRIRMLEEGQTAAAAESRQTLEVVVGNLKRLLPRSPDVGALEFALGRRSVDADFGTPPMLAHSWAILQAQNPCPFPPASYADRMQSAICATRPWLVFNRSLMTERAASPVRDGGKLSSLTPKERELAKKLNRKIDIEITGNQRIKLTRK